MLEIIFNGILCIEFDSFFSEMTIFEHIWKILITNFDISVILNHHSFYNCFKYNVLLYKLATQHGRSTNYNRLPMKAPLWRHH